MIKSGPRLLDREKTVICDGLNYIKGFRYELYCASKAGKTTQITLHCDISVPDVTEWNISRDRIFKQWKKVFLMHMKIKYSCLYTKTFVPNNNRNFRQSLWDFLMFCKMCRKLFNSYYALLKKRYIPTYYIFQTYNILVTAHILRGYIMYYAGLGSRQIF